MTWYFDPDGTTMDVYDHTGSLIASDTPIRYDEDGNQVAGYTGTFPARVKEIARDQMEGDQPSAYNQSLLADMATDNIELGTPP